jgi:thymidylate synthase
MNIDKQYQKLLLDIIHNGVEKKDRTGTGTISVFGRQIRHKMSEGFPLITTKKMAFKTMVTELLWFLRGDTNIKYLVDNGCHIWNGDAWARYEKNAVVGDVVDSHYEPATDKWHLYNKEEFINKIKTDDRFAKKWGELGPIYGKQWRSWEKCELTNDDDFGNNESWGDWNIKHIDQIANLISELKTNPDSRRLMVNSWNVGEIDAMVLPPCHYGFQVYTRELDKLERDKLFLKLNPETKFPRFIESSKFYDEQNIPTRAISLMWNQRSVDTGLGLSFNIASYSLLLMMIAKQVNMVPDELIGNLGDVHLYLNHIEPIKEQLTREPYKLPTVKILDRVVNDISEYTLDDIILENYQSHPAIKMPLSN